MLILCVLQSLYQRKTRKLLYSVNSGIHVNFFFYSCLTENFSCGKCCGWCNFDFTAKQTRKIQYDITEIKGMYSFVCKMAHSFNCLSQIHLYPNIFIYFNYLSSIKINQESGPNSCFQGASSVNNVIAINRARLLIEYMTKYITKSDQI